MADPFSIAASVFTLAAAAGQLSKVISRLRHFGEVPGRLYALKNDISDLALEQHSLAPDNDQGQLQRILSRTKSHLADLGEALERVANACTGSKVKIISKSTIWWKEKALFHSFQEDIRSAKATLNLMLGAANSRDLQNVLLELRRVTLPLNSSIPNDRHLALSTRVDTQYLDLSNRLDTLGESILNGRMQEPIRHDDTLTIHESKIDNQTLRVFASHRIPCRCWCPCACHAKRELKSKAPGMVESVLGRLFIGYSGLSVLNKTCDFRACKDRQNATATVEYWFPWWFVSMNMRLQLTYLPRTGPQFQLPTTRRVADNSQSINFTMQGNIDGLKYLFSKGLAGPRDVSDSRGFTLMRWALYGGMHNYKTVQFLIHQGAYVDENSYDNVWDFIFRNKCNEKEQQALRCITEGGEGDWVAEQNFPLVHKIIFKISSKSLIDELEENPNAVYVTDAQNRTALDWATARVQLEDTSLLLGYGADPNNMDITGRTPVLHAVDSHNALCLNLILKAGGNPDPTMPHGVFRSSPLTAAGFSGMPELLKLLLDFEADPNACNPEGMTALHSVARTHNVDCALLLLEFGADLNAKSSNGRTPLTTAIIHNNRPVLQLFVDRCYEYITTMRLHGFHILQIIAEHADIDTMHILASSHPMKVSYDVSVDSIATSRLVLQQRRGCDEKLTEAFDELIAIAKADDMAAKSIDSLAESGLFHSARSSFHSDLAEAMARLDSAAVSPADSENFEDIRENLIRL